MLRLEVPLNVTPTQTKRNTIFVSYEHGMVRDHAASILTGVNSHVMTANGPEVAHYEAKHYPRAIHLPLTGDQMPEVNCVGLESSAQIDELLERECGSNEKRFNLARASEICREYYAAMGAYGEPWCERWNGEMWRHWRDQGGRI